jgi:hypothetical protein
MKKPIKTRLVRLTPASNIWLEIEETPMPSIRATVEQRVREAFADLGIPSEYAKVTYGPRHPLSPKKPQTLRIHGGDSPVDKLLFELSLKAMNREDD